MGLVRCLVGFVLAGLSLITQGQVQALVEVARDKERKRCLRLVAHGYVYVREAADTLKAIALGEAAPPLEDFIEHVPEKERQHLV